MGKIPNIFHIAQSGMHSAKLGIATSGQNITNASTPGYSRQKMEIQASCISDLSNHTASPLGQGVEVKNVHRIIDPYIENQLSTQLRQLAYFVEGDEGCKKIQNIFNELDSIGLNDSLGKFFNSFRALSNEPQSSSLRQNVQEQAENLSLNIRTLATQLKELNHHFDMRLEQMCMQANRTIQQVSETSEQIKFLMHNPDIIPNELLDQQQMLIKQLQELADISVWQDNKSTMYIELKNIGPLVNGPIYEQITTERTPHDLKGKQDNSLDLYLSYHEQPITHRIQGGKIGALLEVRDQILSQAIDRLDSLAFILAENVNTIHQQGVDLLNQPAGNFFESLSRKEGAAGQFYLNQDIIEDANLISAGETFDAMGDNKIAHKIASLQYAKICYDERMTIEDWYQSFIGEVGNYCSQKAQQAEHQKDIVHQLEKMREAVSGVSIDEETTQLMQFQNIFGACARVIQIADEMLKTILSLSKNT